jgi:hypothetical protein
MRPWLKPAALSAVLAASALAAAIELRAGQLAAPGMSASNISASTRQAAAEGILDDITGSIPAAFGGPRAHYLPLTDEQRGHIFDGVMKLPNAPVADMAAPAAAVPGSVALQDLPVSVTREIPMVEGYKFVKLDDRILLVSPLDRAVVADMPRYKQMLD